MNRKGILKDIYTLKVENPHFGLSELGSFAGADWEITLVHRLCCKPTEQSMTSAMENTDTPVAGVGKPLHNLMVVILPQ